MLIKKLFCVLCLVCLSATETFAAPQPPGAVSATDVQLWHRFGRAAVARNKPNQQEALRVLGYLALAQYEAARAALADEGAPSEASVAAAIARASADTLAGFFPTETSGAQALLMATRGGLGYSGGNEAESRGDAHGAKAAQAILARATADGFTAPWSGSMPTDAEAWRSQLNPPRPPVLPQLGAMRTFFIAHGDALRPPAPPKLGSPELATALAELRAFATNPTPEHTQAANFWAMASDSLVAGFWDETAVALIAQHGLSGPEGARVLALTLLATMDANIACHDGKYTYWMPRPPQADPTIKPIIGMPNHPSYPANHACDSGAAALMLAYFFPDARDRLLGLAQEASMSRLYAGIHYRFDIDAGLRIARGASDAAIAAAQTAAFASPPAPALVRK